MINTSANRRTAQRIIAILVAFLALLDSHQVSGRIPCARKVTTPAKLTHMRLIRKSSNEPNAAFCCECKDYISKAYFCTGHKLGNFWVNILNNAQ